MDKGDISFEDARKYFISVCKDYKEVINKLFDSDLTVCLKKKDNNIKLLEEYKDIGYNIYFLSNMPKETFKKLSKDTNLFDSTCIGGVISADVKMIKPNKDIYKYFLNKFNLISNECFFIDDNFNNVKGAIGVGINSVQLKNIDDMNYILKKELKK